jgi:hypothetical protein
VTELEELKSQIQELRLAHKDLHSRHIELERKVVRQDTPQPDRWLRLGTAARLVGNGWSAYLIKKEIDRARAGKSSLLVYDRHYQIVGGVIKVNLPRFLEIDWARKS